MLTSWPLPLFCHWSVPCPPCGLTCHADQFHADTTSASMGLRICSFKSRVQHGNVQSAIIQPLSRLWWLTSECLESMFYYFADDESDMLRTFWKTLRDQLTRWQSNRMANGNSTKNQILQRKMALQVLVMTMKTLSRSRSPERAWEWAYLGHMEHQFKASLHSIGSSRLHLLQPLHQGVQWRLMERGQYQQSLTWLLAVMKTSHLIGHRRDSSAASTQMLHHTGQLLVLIHTADEFGITLYLGSWHQFLFLYDMFLFCFFEIPSDRRLWGYRTHRRVISGWRMGGLTHRRSWTLLGCLFEHKRIVTYRGHSLELLPMAQMESNQTLCFIGDLKDSRFKD